MSKACFSCDVSVLAIMYWLISPRNFMLLDHSPARVVVIVRPVYRISNIVSCMPRIYIQLLSETVAHLCQLINLIVSRLLLLSWCTAIIDDRIGSDNSNNCNLKKERSKFLHFLPYSKLAILQLFKCLSQLIYLVSYIQLSHKG